jgi:hypothetical protein
MTKATDEMSRERGYERIGGKITVWLRAREGVGCTIQGKCPRGRKLATIELRPDVSIPLHPPPASSPHCRALLCALARVSGHPPAAPQPLTP